MKKAQIANETLFAVGVIVFIFIILTLFTANQRAALNKIQSEIDALKDCYSLANTLSLIFASNDGTTSNLQIQHNITIAANGILRAYKEGETAATCSTNAKAPPGTYSGILKIKKQHGGIEINAA